MSLEIPIGGDKRKPAFIPLQQLPIEGEQPVGAVAGLDDGAQGAAVSVLANRSKGRKIGLCAFCKIAFLGADQQSLVAILEKGEDSVAGESGGIVRDEDSKLDAIKTRQTVESAKPQIAVAGLNDGGDGILGQAVFGFPGSDAVRFGVAEAQTQTCVGLPPDQCETDSTCDRSGCEGARAQRHG